MPIFAHRTMDVRTARGRFPERKTTTVMATFKNYEIEMFGIKFNAKVERKNRKHGESVRIILADQYGFEMYKWISFHSAKEAAISAICAWKSNIPGFEFPSF